MKSKGIKSAVVILAFLIVVFGVLLAYMRFGDMQSGESSLAESDADPSQGYEELYERIVNMTDETYPKKPDEVMDEYTKFYKLLYANYLDDDRLKDYIVKGRIFFGEKLSELNTEESELIIFENEINDMNEAGIRLISVEFEPCKASADDEGVYTSFVTKKMSNGFSSYWKYYIAESADGLYKIRGWERAEQNEA